jgi:hypothetical protein
MSIDFRCPQCKKMLHAPDETVGKNGRCNHCGEIVLVPDPVADRWPPSALRPKQRASATAAASTAPRPAVTPPPIAPDVPAAKPNELVDTVNVQASTTIVRASTKPTGPSARPAAAAAPQKTPSKPAAPSTPIPVSEVPEGLDNCQQLFSHASDEFVFPVQGKQRTVAAQSATILRDGVKISAPAAKISLRSLLARTWNATRRIFGRG